MQLPLWLCKRLVRWLLWQRPLVPYFHLKGYMARYWVIGARSPERNADSPRWQDDATRPTPGGWLYRALCRQVAARLHFIWRSDADRALHDHPFASLSIVLQGGYWEVCRPNKHCQTHPDFYGMVLSGLHGWEPTDFNRITAARYNVHWRGPGSIVWRRAEAMHRLVLPGSDGRSRATEPAVSLFFMGPKRNAWGFWPAYPGAPGLLMPKVGWRQYLASQADTQPADLQASPTTTAATTTAAASTAAEAR